MFTIKNSRHGICIKRGERRVAILCMCVYVKERERGTNHESSEPSIMQVITSSNTTTVQCPPIKTHSFRVDPFVPLAAVGMSSTIGIPTETTTVELFVVI